MQSMVLRGLIAQRPFQPFRIVMSSGQSYDVKHPEMALVTRTEVFVSTGSYDDKKAVARICSLLHVSSIEPIP